MCVDFQAGLVAGGANDSVVRVWDVATERVRVRVCAPSPRLASRAAGALSSLFHSPLCFTTPSPCLCPSDVAGGPLWQDLWRLPVA